MPSAPVPADPGWDGDPAHPRPDEVLAADQRITAWARELRAGGLDGDMAELRARAYLDLFLGKDSRPDAPAAQAAPSGAGPGGFAGKVALAIPLATLTDLADRPGEDARIRPAPPDPGANT